LLQEVGDLKEIIPDEPPLPVRKLLSHAIYDVRVVGPRILALQSFLAEERRRIEEKATQELSRREQEIRDKEIALEQRERELEQREESLDQRERELEKREEDVLREYEEVEKLRSLLLQPAPGKRGDLTQSRRMSLPANLI
jgi:chromosome segregation ATPase